MQALPGLRSRRPDRALSAKPACWLILAVHMDIESQDMPPSDASHPNAARQSRADRGGTDGGGPDLDWRVRIAGLGRYLPQRRVASAEIEQRAGLPEGWSLHNSGVAFRHWAEPERERASWMGAQAALQA
ncbi:MAG: hypothetical protein ACREP7_10975, partial [Lysobacter sp.]